jgi:hypothetical protein
MGAINELQAPVSFISRKEARVADWVSPRADLEDLKKNNSSPKPGIEKGLD